METYKTDGRLLDWTVALETTGPRFVQVGDLAISIPAAGPTGQNPIQIFERGFLRHQFVSGHGSFLYFLRASGAPPFLLVTVLPGTKLGYTGGGAGRGTAQVFVHSFRAARLEPHGTWRQPTTALTLAPAGRSGSKVCYGFRLQWAGSYQELRDLIDQAGLFDIRAAPGMTVPVNLSARVSLHTKARIEALVPEFPGRTVIRRVGEPRPDHHVYEVAFSQLGENLVAIRHDGDRETHLEFFVTEPIETLIKKRAAFLVNRQQIKDPSRWWNGVYAPYDMRARVTRTVEDPDIFLSSYAFAKYGATREMAPDRNLWFDVKLKKWYSHPLVRREDARAFMDRQLASGLAVRGWLNPDSSIIRKRKCLKTNLMALLHHGT